MRTIEDREELGQDGIYYRIGSEGKEIEGVVYKNAKLVSFEGQEYIVSNNAVLTIQQTEICDAACQFCFNGITFYPNQNTKIVASELDRIIAFCKASDINSVTISGWEPTLDIKTLMGLVWFLKWKFTDFRIHSNGHNLFKSIDETWTRLIDFLISNGLNKITLSLAHHQFDKNLALMNFRSQYKGMSEEDIEELWKLSNKCSIRFSCFINKEGIRSIDDMKNYIKFWTDRGIKNFIFRGASNSQTPLHYLKETNFSNFWFQNATSIDYYVQELESAWYQEVRSTHKTDLHIHIVEKDWVRIDLEETTEEPDPDKKIRRLLYFPNGVTYKSWIEPTELLFEWDKEKIITSIINNPVLLQGRKYPAGALGKSIGERLWKNLKKDYQYPVDLHMHTINSDGNKDIMSVLLDAQEKWVKKLTITEHNFISDDFSEVQKLAKEKIDIDIDFPWVEINVVTHPDGKTPDRKHHLLWYGKGLLDAQFQALINLPLKIKNEYYQEQVEHIRSQWLDIPSFEAILKGVTADGTYTTPYKKQMTRNHIAKQIQRITWEDLELIKRKYLKPIPESISYKSYLKAEDIIPIIKELGWVSWLAHPGRDRPFSWVTTNQNINYRHLLAEIWRLKKLGMQGLEINHKSHPPLTKQILQKYSHELMMLVVGWSDYHGTPKKMPDHYDIYPWTFWLTYEEYDKILNLVK